MNEVPLHLHMGEVVVFWRACIFLRRRIGRSGAERGRFLMGEVPLYATCRTEHKIQEFLEVMSRNGLPLETARTPILKRFTGVCKIDP